MEKYKFWLLSLTSILFVNLVSAHSDETSYESHSMMYGFYGIGFFGLTFMSLVLVSLILFIIWLVKQVQK